MADGQPDLDRDQAQIHVRREVEPMNAPARVDGWVGSLIHSASTYAGRGPFSLW